jgi:hypothetical protein
MIYLLCMDEHALHFVSKVVLVWKPLIIELSLRPCIMSIILMDKSLIAESDVDWLDLYNPISHCLEDAAFAYPIGLEVFCDCTNV